MKVEDSSVIWFTMGIALGSVSAFQLVAVAGSTNPASWINQYQALIGAFIAVLAAVITVSAALWVEAKKRQDRLRAHRAMLPFALSELTTYVTFTVARLKSVLPSVSDQLELQIVTECFEAVELPRDSLERLKDVIEVAPLNLTTELANLIAKCQIYHSRLEDAKVKSEIRHASFVSIDTVRRRIVEHLELQARVARFFDFARFLKDHISQGVITETEMLTAARLNKIFDDDELEQRIKEHVAFQRQNSLSPRN